MAREALGVVGAAVGFVASGGNPLGAQIGFAVGAGVGGALFPTRIPHPGLNDAPIQTSRDGIPIPIILGLHYCHGNIVQKNPEEIVTTTSRQGKGGGTEVEEKTRFRTYLIGICEGPIAQVTRVWRNNQLVYDARSTPDIPAAESAKFLENTTFYLGGEDQLPDSEIESYWTTAETPAYRGLAMMAKHNEDLTDTGGSIPQYAFEVNGSSDATVTSKPYPIELTDGVDVTPTPTGWNIYDNPLDGVDAGVALQSWAVNNLLESYDYETEGVDATVALQSWTVNSLLESYEYETEGVDAGVALQSWVIDERLVAYDYEPEGVDAGVALLSWTVSTP